MSMTKEQLIEVAQKTRNELWAIEARERAGVAKSLIGKCFRYRNSYSCPSKPSDYWWLYVRVIGSTSGGYVRSLNIQKDSDGKVSIGIEERGIPELIAAPDSSYVPITRAAFDTAWRKTLTYVNRLHR